MSLRPDAKAESEKIAASCRTLPPSSGISGEVKAGSEKNLEREAIAGLIARCR